MVSHTTRLACYAIPRRPRAASVVSHRPSCFFVCLSIIACMHALLRAAASRASPLGIPATAWRAGASRLHRTHADPYVRGEFSPRREWSDRDWTQRAFTIGIGGPVGSGKTALVLQLCRRLRERLSIAVVTNDIFTKEVRPRALSHPACVAALRPLRAAAGRRIPHAQRCAPRGAHHRRRDWRLSTCCHSRGHLGQSRRAGAAHGACGA